MIEGLTEVRWTTWAAACGAAWAALAVYGAWNVVAGRGVWSAIYGVFLVLQIVAAIWLIFHPDKAAVIVSFAPAAVAVISLSTTLSTSNANAVPWFALAVEVIAVVLTFVTWSRWRRTMGPR